MSETAAREKPATEGAARIVYILYLVGIVIGITGLIGVIIAYVNRNDAPDWLETHYQFQIRTFWIGILYMLIGTILTVILVGYLVYLFVVIWLIVRCIKGLKSLDTKEACPDPAGWLF